MFHPSSVSVRAGAAAGVILRPPSLLAGTLISVEDVN
jgi:hypothetical protein